MTNAELSIAILCKAYPRGGKELKGLFSEFNTKHTMEWFENRNVPLVIQEDGCVFPESQNSQSIIDCFLREAAQLNISIQNETGIRKIEPQGQVLLIHTDQEVLSFNQVIVTTGGAPKRSGLKWLEDLGHEIEEPVPSLFTFNMPENDVTKLMGVVVERARTQIKGTNFKANGPLLITHWGMSGPAVLVLSAFGARWMSENNYTCTLQVNWVDEVNHEVIAERIREICVEFAQKQLSSIRPFFLPSRLWEFLLQKYAFDPTMKWNEIGKKGVNRIVTLLTNDEYEVQGKTTFKEEFVTCGGISRNSIDMKTMQSKVVPGLFFAGEVTDIDAITGGYNFQAAWTTGFIAGKLGQ